MAEAGPSNSFKFNFPNPNPNPRRGNRGGNRTYHKNNVQDDETNAPKIIFQKRPPRRPKLPNGSVAPCVPISQVIENSEKFNGNFEGGANQSVGNSSETNSFDHAIQEIGDNVAALKLSKESSEANVCFSIAFFFSITDRMIINLFKHNPAF